MLGAIEAYKASLTELPALFKQTQRQLESRIRDLQSQFENSAILAAGQSQSQVMAIREEYDTKVCTSFFMKHASLLLSRAIVTTRA